MPTLDDTLALVTEAFAGKTDLAGRPYIEHLTRVMGLLGPDATDDEKHVALLHDMLEDTDWTFAGLAYAGGYSANVLVAVILLTRDKDVSYPAYIESIALQRSRAGAIARKVKIADLTDNLDPDRQALLEPEKAASLAKRYRAALAVLTSP